MTYRCLKCGYGQDFEPTKEALAFHFPELKEPCGAYECPAYYKSFMPGDDRQPYFPCKGEMKEEQLTLNN